MTMTKIVYVLCSISFKPNLATPIDCNEVKSSIMNLLRSILLIKFLINPR